MKTSKILNRIKFLPKAILKGICRIAIEETRNLENQERFPNAVIDEKTSLSADSAVGQNSLILRGSYINHSQIGDFTYVGYNAIIQHTTIGNYCSISGDVKIGLGKHPLAHFSTSPVFYKAINNLNTTLLKQDLDFVENEPITIGSDVWIGANVLVMDGVTIGHGAVLAAGAVVTKDVPPYAIVGGTPAKIIRYRFPEAVREGLLRTKWWEKKPEEVFAIKAQLSAMTMSGLLEL